VARSSADFTSLAQRDDLSETPERLTEVRYRAAGEPLQLWLAAQDARRQAELALSGNRLAQLKDYATLCQAQGGGAGRF
jgi:hypothetical protein